MTSEACRAAEHLTCLLESREGPKNLSLCGHFALLLGRMLFTQRHDRIYILRRWRLTQPGDLAPMRWRGILRSIMRVNLNARAVNSHCSDVTENTILLTIRPACPLPGDYSYTTDSDSLLRMLRRQTDLPATVLEKFENAIYKVNGANLLAVEISEKTLTEIGYFVD